MTVPASQLASPSKSDILQILEALLASMVAAEAIRQLRKLKPVDRIAKLKINTSSALISTSTIV